MVLHERGKHMTRRLANLGFISMAIGLLIFTTQDQAIAQCCSSGVGCSCYPAFGGYDCDEYVDMSGQHCCENLGPCCCTGCNNCQFACCGAGKPDQIVIGCGASRAPKSRQP